MRPGHVVAAVIGSLVGACGPNPSSANGSPPDTGGDDGWSVLFDGKSTEHLRAYGRDTFPSEGWAIDGDALRTIDGQPVDLISREAFSDFELAFEWRVGPGANGGLMYRVAETPEPSWASGPEYQILDDAGHRDGLLPETSAAALYGLLAPPADKPLAPVGEYNEGRIVVGDGHVEHWLNGERVVAYDWGSPAIRSRIAGSKFRDLPGFMAEDAGHIVLQHHGPDVWYRDVRIRRLGG